MKYGEALPIAKSWLSRLAPYCERIEIAGSIRRKKTEVKDIELLCIPKTVVGQGGIFGDYPEGTIFVRDPGFGTALLATEEEVMIEKGKTHTGKYIRLMLLKHQIKIDVFVATPENWGYLLAIRTGPAEYSHKVLANRWVKMGYRGEDGMLMKGEDPVPIFEEQHLYNLLKLPYQEPPDRSFPVIAKL